MVALLEDMSINTEVTGVQAPWQLAVGERHGGILGGLWRAVIHEHQCSDRECMKAALDAAVHAKNSTMTRNGFTPYQAVFGFHPRDPCSALQEDGQDNLPSADLGPDCEAGRAAAMRHTAKLAILRLDVKDKLRRAVTRQPPSKAHDYEFMPGTRVYFWDAHPGKGRYRDDPGRWKGPALILLREKGNRYFCSWHGRLMLLSGENLRPSSSEESAAFDMIAAEADAFGKEQQEDHSGECEDKTDDPPPPEAADVEYLRSRMLQGLKSVRRFILKDKPKNKGRKRAQPIAMEADPEYEPSEGDAPQKDKSEPAAEQLEDYGPHGEEAPMTPSEISDEEFWEGEHAEDDNRRKDHVSQIRQSIRSKMTNPEAQKDSVDDVPMSIKRALELPMEDEAESKKVKFDRRSHGGHFGQLRTRQCLDDSGRASAASSNPGTSRNNSC